ncbi:DNA damage-regulated autophagy modulator protein 2-like isoform X1 [Periplaneta americana]|uniref:DNA damage-regulated autophagy modulator protein 2-like isoform X1 n=1 Tax=Periplaneta americana TaxID=6978 RepID=UPI0037E98D26
MVYERVYLLPLAIFIIFPCTFLGTYIAAVLLGHVEPDFPYISDAATHSPESCVFGQLMNGGTVLLVLVIYIRYRQIDEYYRNYTLSSSIVKHNKIAMWIGFVSCFGLSLVANFQETNVIIVHLTGAFLCFGLGTVYIWLQAICSYYLHPLANSIAMAHIRVALAMICTIFFILLSITGVISHLQFHGKDPRKWYPEDGGWEMHVVSTVSEWIVATSFCVYILSFVREFRTLSMEEPQIYLTVERTGIPNVNSETSPIIARSSAADEVNVIVRQEGSSIIT